MTLNEYQDAATRTAIYPKDKGLEYTILGLCGESGELANKYKKVLRGDYDSAELKTTLAKELGDVLWYTAMCAKENGMTLEAVAHLNITKLHKRQEDGKLRGSGDER